MAGLKNALPKTWSSPTMSPHCADETKYGVVDDVVKHFEAEQKSGGKVAGQPIRDLVTVNGVRVTVEDGTWALAAPHPTSRSWSCRRKPGLGSANARHVQVARHGTAHAQGSRRV